MKDVARVWLEGEFVRLEHQGKTGLYGVVKTVTANGAALIVEVNDLEHERSAPVPVLWDSGRGTFVGVCGHPIVLHEAGPPAMSQWIIYHGARNHPPAAWVVRRWDIYPNACLPARETIECPSLEAARERVPPWMVLTARHPSDDPAVHEVWI